MAVFATACLSCRASLAAHEHQYHVRCASGLWDRAPLPEGHPAGTVGADLFSGFSTSSEAREPEVEQLELGL